jgi:hypothetical protein
MQHACGLDVARAEGRVEILRAVDQELVPEGGRCGRGRRRGGGGRASEEPRDGNVRQVRGLDVALCERGAQVRREAGQRRAAEVARGRDASRRIVGKRAGIVGGGSERSRSVVSAEVIFPEIRGIKLFLNTPRSPCGTAPARPAGMDVIGMVSGWDGGSRRRSFRPPLQTARRSCSVPKGLRLCSPGF